MDYKEVRTNIGTIIATWQGIHTTTRTYKVLNIVSDNNGSTYLCISDTIKGVPLADRQHWQFLAKGAYQYWLDLGNVGTTQDFINWLKSPAENVVNDITNFVNTYIVELIASLNNALSVVNAKILNMEELINSFNDYETLLNNKITDANNAAVYANQQGQLASTAVASYQSEISKLHDSIKSTTIRDIEVYSKEDFDNLLEKSPTTLYIVKQ